MKSFDYVILGGGLGGLSAAACLARQGHEVAVLEKHYLPGGCCHTFDYGEYRFCADVHYISQCGSDQTITQLLNYLECNVPFNSLDPDCIDRVITPEVDFKIPLGWETLRTRLLATFPEEHVAINRYCDEIRQLHQDIHHLVQEVHWYNQKWFDWLKLPKYWNLFSKRDWTLQDLYDHVGLSPKLQNLLAGQSGDYALPPNEIALLTHTSLVWDYSEGAYYPNITSNTWWTPLWRRLSPAVAWYSFQHQWSRLKCAIARCNMSPQPMGICITQKKPTLATSIPNSLWV